MTSSFKGPSHASVRATPTAQIISGDAWFLAEFVVGAGSTESPSASRGDSDLVADDGARLIDESYARGLADGEARGRAAAQAMVDDALNLAHEATARLNDAAKLAPSI